MVKKKPAKRGRPSSGIKRPHRVVVIFSAEEIEEINAAAGPSGVPGFARSRWLPPAARTPVRDHAGPAFPIDASGRSINAALVPNSASSNQNTLEV